MSREYRADLTPYAGPQCYPQVRNWEDDSKKALAKSNVDQEKKRVVRVAAEGEARTASGMHLREGVPV